MDFQFESPDFFQDPYPYYAQMRATEEPYWLGIKNQTKCDGIWLFSRYKDALSIFKESSALSKNVRAVRLPEYQTPFDLIMLHRDSSDHIRLRRLVSNYFSARSIQLLEPRVAKLCSELLQSLSIDGQVDLISGYAEPLPLIVISELMGIPLQDREQIREWSLQMSDGFDSTLTNPDILKTHIRALREFLSYIKDAIAIKRREHKDDLLSFLVNAQTEGKIDEEELTALAGFLIFAGHETTVSLIGSGVWLLLQHPDQLTQLQNKPELIANAVEEILRYESPEQRTTFRLTTSALDVGNVRIEKGQQVGIVIGAANRDERAFPNADKFDVTRTPNHHLAFGAGVHQCLGMHMARMQTRLAIGALIAKYPTLRLLDKHPNWRKNTFFRALLTLPIQLR